MQKEAKPHQLHLTYNPYAKEQRMECQFYEPGTGTWEDIKPENEELYKFLQENHTLQHKVKQLFDILHEFSRRNSAGLALEFSGLETDLNYLKTYFEQHSTGERTPISVKQGSWTLVPATEAMPYIEKQFAGLKTLFDQVCQEDAGLKELLEQYEETVRPTISICVVGTYSSGKSALINALIGEEVLPSEENPTTAKIYKIMPCKKGEPSCISFEHGGTKFKLEFFENGDYTCTPSAKDDIVAAWTEEMERMDKASIRAQRVYHSLKLINEKANEKDGEGLRYQIHPLLEVQVPFDSTLPLEEFEFEIYDTPGSNSESHKEHLDVLEGILNKLTNGLPVIVTTPMTLDSNDTQQLLKELEAHGGHLDLGNAVIAVNQADKSSPEKLKALASKEDSCIQQWRSRLLFVSAIMALASKKRPQGTFWDSDYGYAYDNTVASFTRPEHKHYHQLFLCDLLPGDGSVQELHRRGKAATGAGASQQTLLLHNSGLWALEYEIGEYARNFALYNKCCHARDFLDKLIEMTKEKIEVQQEKIERALQDVQAQLSEKQTELLTTLTSETELRRGSDNREYTEKLKAQEASFWKGFEKGLEKFLQEMNALVAEKKRDGHTAEVNRRVKDFICEELSKIQSGTNRIAVSYWGEASERFKQLCVKIVTDSDALSAENQEKLADFILKQPKAKMPQPQGIDLDGVVVKKRFLFWAVGEKFQTKECRDRIKQAIKKTSQDFWNDEAECRNRIYTQWTEDLLSKVKLELAKWNSSLAQLTQDIEEQKTHLREVESQLEMLKDAGKEVDSVLKIHAYEQKDEGGSEV